MKVALRTAACALLALIALEPSLGKRTRPDNGQGVQRQTLLGEAREFTDIRSSGNRPFRLVARVQLYDGKALTAQGMYTLMWQIADSLEG